MTTAETVTVIVLRTSGLEEVHEVPRQTVWKDIQQLIAAEMLEFVNLRDGRIMIVDDRGYEVELVEQPPLDGIPVIERVAKRARKPANAAATVLYHAICEPGTTHQIVGDVALVTDQDFADDDDKDDNTEEVSYETAT